MKYVSIDIETTGLDPINNDILEIGAIVEDTLNKLPREQCPQFHVYIDKPIYRGDAFAIAMNADIFKKIVQLRKDKDTTLLVTPDKVADLFKMFVTANGIDKVIPAGKNFPSFDKRFLEEGIPNWRNVRFHHRTLDPTMLFINMIQDTAPPDLSTCKQRADFVSTVVTHEALDDAWDVIELLRTRY